MDELKAKAADVLAAYLATFDANAAYGATRGKLTAAAAAAGVAGRAVFVFGGRAVYIDPPGTHSQGNTWLVSFGSPPEDLGEFPHAANASRPPPG